MTDGPAPSPAPWLSRGAAGSACAALTGALLILAFPKFGQGLIGWVAPIPLLVTLARRHGRQAGRLTYLSGVVSSLGLLYWTANVAQQFGGVGWPVALLVALALSCTVALFYALFGAVLGLWLRRYGNAALVAAPAAWVAVEWLRATGPLAFPWCLLGYTQDRFLPVIQVASLTGVYGVSFVVLLVSAAAALAIVDRGRWRIAGAAAALVTVVIVYGWLRLAVPPPAIGTLRVGLIQASVPQEEKWSVGLAWRNVSWHEDLSREAAAQGATLLIWPESSVPFYFDWTPAVAERLRSLARETHAYVLFGNDDREAPLTGERVWVGAKLLDPEGRLTFRYHKMQLVPFGEYVPFARLLGALGVEKLVQEVGSFTPGAEAVVGTIGAHPFGLTICYEAIFPQLVRRFTVGGAELLANITNDGWYGRTSAPYQHFAMARLRAVENGRSLARAANTGISALIDPRGRVLAGTQLFERRSLVGDVPLVRESTFYARHGDLFAWLCVAVTVGLTLHALGRSRRAAQPADGGGAGNPG